MSTALAMVLAAFGAIAGTALVVVGVWVAGAVGAVLGLLGYLFVVAAVYGGCRKVTQRPQSDFKRAMNGFRRPRNSSATPGD